MGRLEDVYRHMGQPESPPDFVCPECGGDAHIRVTRDAAEGDLIDTTCWCNGCGLTIQGCSGVMKRQFEVYLPPVAIVSIGVKLLHEASTGTLMGDGYAVDPLSCLAEEPLVRPAFILSDAETLTQAGPSLESRISDVPVFVLEGNADRIRRFQGIPSIPLEKLVPLYDLEWVATRMAGEIARSLRPPL